MDNKDNKDNKDLSYLTLIKGEKYSDLRKELTIANRTSVSGITNFVTKYECPTLIDTFVDSCFETSWLFNETSNIDLALISNNPFKFIETLIFGEDSGCFNLQTGVPKRAMDEGSFVNRKEVLVGSNKDKTLILRNLDLCEEFYNMKEQSLTPKALALFNHFRSPMVKKGLRIFLVSNTAIVFPFKTRRVYLPYTDLVDARFILDSSIELYRSGGYKIDLQDCENTILEYLSQDLFTYIHACDLLLEAISTVPNSKQTDKDKKIIGGKDIANNLIDCIRKERAAK